MGSANESILGHVSYGSGIPRSGATSLTGLSSMQSFVSSSMEGSGAGGSTSVSSFSSRESTSTGSTQKQGSASKGEMCRESFPERYKGNCMQEVSVEAKALMEPYFTKYERV